MSPLSIRHFRHVMLLLSLWMLLCGCATQQPKKTMVWQSRDQFVAVTEREAAAGAASANQPVSLSRRDLRAELASLKLKPTGKQQPVNVFGEPELRTLTEQLHAALQQAKPTQDVIFAVYGAEPVLHGFGSVEVITTGRAFYQNDRLNLIFGMVRESIRELDRRLQPFVPGSRLKPATVPAVVTASANAAFATGRPDWLLLKVPQEDPNAAKEEAAEAPQEAAQPAVSEPARPEPFKGGAPTLGKRLEERLRVLGELRAKGLITEEEYRLKKESILREL